MTDRADRKQEDAHQTPTPYQLEETLAADIDKVRAGACGAESARQAADTSAESEPPPVFGRYRIQSVLGGGGMGTVYLAHDTQLDRDIALKIPKFRADEEEDVVQRFYREARAMAALRHQNLCTVYDVGEIDGIHYLTMAYIHGRPLSQVIGSGRFLPNRTAAAVIRKLALALHQAHRAGVVHRDVKPANIIIDQTSQPVVVDFGLAHHQRSDQDQQDGVPTIAGTPAYMSPEQVEGQLEAIGPASDIYSLGVILYRLLAGRLPYQGSLRSVLTRILHDQPPSPSTFNGQIDSALETVCLQAMAKDPQRRFASMEEMAKSLAEYLKATAADASTSVAVATPSEDRHRTLASTEIVVLCPICVTRIDVAAESVGREIECPQCHTPIALRSYGAANADHAAAVQGEEDFYQLAKPVERLSIPLSDFETSSETDTLPSTDKTTPSVDMLKGHASDVAGTDNAAGQLWQTLELARLQAESFVRAASNVDFSLRWLGASGFFYMCLPLAMHLVSDIRVNGLGRANAWIFIVVPTVAVSAVLSAGYCLAVFQASANGDSHRTLRLKLNLTYLRTCPYVLVPLFLAVVPGLAGNLLLGIIGAPLALRALILTLSLFGLFPVFFLSSVQSQSVFTLISSPVLRSIREKPHAWRVFCLISAFFVIAVPLVTAVMTRHRLLATPLAAIVLSALTLVYFQSIGQLARDCCATSE